MTDHELRALLRGGEGSRVEFKRALHRDQVKETIVAFANRSWEPEPAVLFLGVDDDGTIVGLDNPEEAQKNVRRYVGECYPPIDAWEVRPLEQGGRVVLAVIVPDSKSAPHFTGGAFVRQGSENVKANAQHYDRLLANRASAGRALGPWIGKEILAQQERQINTGARVWGETHQRRIISVSPEGIVLDGGGYTIRADWSRVKLQPHVDGELPLVRIAAD